MKLLRRLFLVNVIVALSLALAPLRASVSLCGDVNASGFFDFGDFVETLAMLHSAYPPLVQHSQGDVDKYSRVTSYDAIKMFDDIFFNAGPVRTFTCTTFFPPLDPPVNQNVRVVYIDTVSAGASSAVIPVNMATSVPFDWVTLPLLVRLDGVAPTIDSIVFDTLFAPGFTSIHFQNIRPDLGAVNVVITRFLRPFSGAQHVMDIHITVPPAPSLRTVDLEFTKIRPLNAPFSDTGVIPMVTEYTSPLFGFPEHKPYTPALLRAFMCGDVNHDYVIDSLDAQIMIDYYFACGPAPAPLESGDVNCDSRIDFSDVALIAATAEGSNPTLCCVQDLFPTQGDTTSFPAPTPRQDSLLAELLQAISDYGL